jgi:hypothetical protein
MKVTRKINTAGYTLFQIWGRTGPFDHNTTNGCNYSPNQFRPSQYLSAAMPSNDLTYPGGITLDVVNIRYTGDDPLQSSEDINPTFRNWAASFGNAHTYWLMGQVYGTAKTYFPNIKILGEYDFMLGSKQYPCNRGKVVANTYEIDIMSGYGGSDYAPPDATNVFPPLLDGVSPLLGMNYLSSTNFNRELQQSYGLAASNQPHERPVLSSNRSGWVGNGFGPAGLTGAGFTEAGGWFDKKVYRAFLERCYQAGITGVSGAFNATGSYFVNLGGSIGSTAESFLNQQDMIRARIEFNIKQAQQIYNNLFYFEILHQNYI